MNTSEQFQQRDSLMKEMGLTLTSQVPQLRLIPQEYKGWGVALGRVTKIKAPEKFFEAGCDFIDEHLPMEMQIHASQDLRLQPDLNEWFGPYKLAKYYRDYPDLGLGIVEVNGWRRALDRLIHLTDPEIYYQGVNPQEHWQAEMQIALAQEKYARNRQSIRDSRIQIGVGALVIATIAAGGGFIYQENWSPDAERKRKEAYQSEHELIARSPLDEFNGWIEPVSKGDIFQPTRGERNSFRLENGKFIELPGGLFDSVRATAIQVTGYKDSKGVMRPKFVIVQKRERPANKITEFKERIPVGEDHPLFNSNIIRFRRGQDDQVRQIEAIDPNAPENKVSFEFIRMSRGGDTK